MKGPNPFLPWAGPEGLSGRRAEYDMYNGILNRISGGTSIAIVVSGIPGIGKSEMLRSFQKQAEKAGFLAPLITAGAESHSPFLSKMRSVVRGYLLERASEGVLQEHLAERVDLEGEDFIIGLWKAVQRHASGIIIIIDDLDSLKEQQKAMAFIRGKALRALKIGIIASSTKELAGFDAVMNLKPFDEHGLREMVESGLKKGPPKMGEGCLAAILSDSSGNPLVARAICYVLYDKLKEGEKIITERHYIVHMPAIMGMLSRELFDGLYEQLPGSERKVLRAFSESGQWHISDIAKKLRMRHATTLALRLEERGQLVRVDRGIYKVFTKLYGKYVMQRQ